MFPIHFLDPRFPQKIRADGHLQSEVYLLSLKYAFDDLEDLSITREVDTEHGKDRKSVHLSASMDAHGLQPKPELGPVTFTGSSLLHASRNRAHPSLAAIGGPP
jgi:hypothetical protein